MSLSDGKRGYAENADPNRMQAEHRPQQNAGRTRNPSISDASKELADLKFEDALQRITALPHFAACLKCLCHQKDCPVPSVDMDWSGSPCTDHSKQNKTRQGKDGADLGRTDRAIHEGIARSQVSCGRACFHGLNRAAHLSGPLVLASL